MTIQAIEFYSGIGGLHRALQKSNVDATVIRAFDWDQTACRVYEENHGKGVVSKTDISTLDEHRLAALNASLWLLSPSCQPYTVLNHASKGAEDPRAKSFIHLMFNVLPVLVGLGRAPARLLVENVAGFEKSSTRKSLIQKLASLGYATMEFLLTPLQFGIPNSRLRYYLLAKLRPLRFTTSENPERVWTNIPGHGDPWVDDRMHTVLIRELPVAPLRRYLDSCDMAANESLRIPDRVLEKWGRLFDIVLPSSSRSCCFTRGYTQMVERGGSILQMNEELDTTETFNEFLAAQEERRNSALDVDKTPVAILHPLGLRYFSPSELLRLFNFTHPPDSSEVEGGLRVFNWPKDVSEKSKYRLLGNSVNVEVVRQLLEYLFESDVSDS
ncbi:S-adenosyl-L-methionine-dependent methyltransferase [Schizopora paradoxa]|uniref:tRNA (cytosine(38)-C(5))-methyltransferase n=1 Tax=Schizopora paradoxa TaxID=27342 RepID=A0A0H2R3B0_9AGAM|nr:S-adenosyl-L-methionine-dependent methyltransferase [Schizopora paradoxa]